MNRIGEWNPDDTKSRDYQISISTLEALARLGTELPEQGPDQVKLLLTDRDINEYRHLMRLHRDAWTRATPQLSDEQLVQLIRFFTLAEMQLPGWESENRSPVIWLCRELKQRGKFPDKALITWIRENSSNRFLPYGNLLDL